MAGRGQYSSPFPSRSQYRDIASPTGTSAHNGMLENHGVQFPQGDQGTGDHDTTNAGDDDDDDFEEDAPGDIATPANLGSTPAYVMPIPPEGGPGGGEPAETADELLLSLKAFAEPHGYALVKKQASNKAKDGQYTRYSVTCDRDGYQKSQSKGLRKRDPSRKIGCPFRGIAKRVHGGDAGSGWVFVMDQRPQCRVHNHGPKTESNFFTQRHPLGYMSDLLAFQTKTAKQQWHNGPRDSWHGFVDPGGRFAPEPARYHLYIGLFCPFAHRVNLVRHLKGLQDIVPISVVKPYPKGDDNGWPGWEFAGCRGAADIYEGATKDSLFDSSYLHDIYFRAEKEYQGRYSVPLMWDKKEQTIVSNESLEMLRWMQTSFDGLLPWNSYERHLNLYPVDMQEAISTAREWITRDLNSGVYKAGFATKQAEYDKQLPPVFAALNQLELLIAKHGGPYILGKTLTELDILAYPTIVRFDVIYVQHFKCNLGTIRADYPVIHEWLKNLYWNVKGFRETTDFRHIKENYSRSHAKINPLAITPTGPFPDIKKGINAELAGQLRPGSIDHPAVLEYQKTLPPV